MALKGVLIWGNYVPQLSCKIVGVHLTSKPSSGDSLNLKREKWECLSSQRAITPVEDENPSLEFKQILVPIEEVDSKKFYRDLSFLPKPFSITNFSASNNDATNERVAYQRVPGAYSEAVALKAYPECKAVPCDQFKAAFKAVELWLALAQCEMYLTKLGVMRKSADDTVGAAQFVALNCLKDTKAVTSARAADIYGLKVLAEKIQDYFKNITRFLILAREPIIPIADRPFKTSIVFTLEEGLGVLLKALAIFAMREINLTKIKSRPQRKWPLRVVDDLNAGCAKYFDYLFYIDFEASMAEERAQNALIHLHKFTPKIGKYDDDQMLKSCGIKTDSKFTQGKGRVSSDPKKLVEPTRVNDQYLTNILLKINGNLGGLNSMLTTKHGLNIPVISKAPAMTLGMDVSHGSPG
ncbi:hypothetical protein GIB67_039077 [Kingdonia uniflora]|uniref:arogenate dehydratase n=1 Tax=Kingdonia uniflora TaxID=39325 RepID=A0A7J7LLA2_9MAGN|nr:hypothetical protein GIB67_039077 [Kingdonia uniflora]